MPEPQFNILSEQQTSNVTRVHFFKFSKQISRYTASQHDLGVWEGNLIFEGILALVLLGRGQHAAFIPVFKVDILNNQVMHFSPPPPYFLMVKADIQFTFDGP